MFSSLFKPPENVCREPEPEPLVCEAPPPAQLFETPEQTPATGGFSVDPSQSPFAGMYDDPPLQSSSEPLDHCPVNPTPEQKQKIDAEAEKLKEEQKAENIKKIQSDIDDAKTLEAEAAKLEASGDKAAAAQKRAEAGQKKQAAIDRTVTTYEIDVSNAEFVKYDSATRGEGETTPTADRKKGKIKIGDKAFTDPGWLASTIGHESEVHINKQLMKGNWYTGNVGTDLQEVETYQYEIDNAKRYGLNKTQIADVTNRRKSHYDNLPADYQQRADKGDYTMKAGEENK